MYNKQSKPVFYKFSNCVITRIISGIYIDKNDMYVQGIDKITSRDFKYADYLNSTIKHLAIADYNSDKKFSNNFVTSNGFSCCTQ